MVEDVSENEGKIIFRDHIQLALLKTKNADIWEILGKRDYANRPTYSQSRYVAEINDIADKIDRRVRPGLYMINSRVKLCFQVIVEVQLNIAKGSSYKRKCYVYRDLHFYCFSIGILIHS